MGNIEGRFRFCYVLLGQAVVCNIAESDAKPQVRWYSLKLYAKGVG